MTTLGSHENRPRDLTGGDAYRFYLISRNQPPIVHHSRKMQMKRLRVAGRHARRQIRGFLTFMHNAMVAAKMRRIERELLFHAGSHDDWSRSAPQRRDGHGLDIRDFPQRPLMLGEKWDY